MNDIGIFLAELARRQQEERKPKSFLELLAPIQQSPAPPQYGSGGQNGMNGIGMALAQGLGGGTAAGAGVSGAAGGAAGASAGGAAGAAGGLGALATL